MCSALPSAEKVELSGFWIGIARLVAIQYVPSKRIAMQTFQIVDAFQI